MELVCIWLLYMCPFLIITGPACRCVFRIPQGQLQCSKIAFCHAKPAADALVLVHMRTLPVYFNHFHRADLHALTAGAASVQPLSNEPGSSGDSVLPTPQRIKENAAALAAIATVAGFDQNSDGTEKPPDKHARLEKYWRFWRFYRG